jgi:type I restriction enzyme S subunit
LLWCPIAEQRKIVAHITSESAPLNTAITRLEREIELLREYRTRLVADVVTGKLDVREAACELPAESPEIETPSPNIEEDFETETITQEINA